MYKVFVLDMNGNPMDPTVRFWKVRRMLNSGIAKVVKDKPFTIQLLYETETHVVHELYGGTDGGRTNIGNAVIRADGIAVYADHVTTRNKDITKNMKDRATHRRASRRGERQRRKRRAKKNGTTTHKYDETGRTLPGCEKPTMMKDIINTESRFANRTHKYKKELGRQNPTLTQLIQTHLNQVDNIRSILPVSKWTIELNRFAFMQMEDGTVYQQRTGKPRISIRG